ncbi:MAG TPA: hypothetical protein VFX14_24155 [Methylomirabilota bacterium]|nr:hypothetical protein [Methylomirabilota bacterium]
MRTKALWLAALAVLTLTGLSADAESTGADRLYVMDCGHSAAADQSHRASLTRVADLLEEKKAQLWINHDKPQSLSLKHSPEYYE